MPIIIWGTRGVTSTLESGEFFCPVCDAREEYSLRQVRPFFTLFFIPLFPIGGADKYVECRGCGRAFKEEVRHYEPPSEAERLLGQFYSELRTGTSVEVIRRKLEDAGLDGDRADDVLDQMCEGRPRACGCGAHYHPDVRRCSECGAKL